MTRQDWLLVSEELSIPIYRAFTPQQRFDFWQEKLDEVLALDWNEKERAHIIKMKEFIKENPDWFDDSVKNDEQRWGGFVKFDEEWRNQAIEQLGWSKQLVGAIIADGRILIDRNGMVKPLKNYKMDAVP